jgi:hypothetical protein
MGNRQVGEGKKKAGVVALGESLTRAHDTDDKNRMNQLSHKDEDDKDEAGGTVSCTCRRQERGH